jgi:tetratricopeptide (TPR) repeat protein
MKAINLLILFTFLFGSLVAQSSPEEAFNKGNAFYKEGKFQEALEAYKTIEKMDLESAELYYNMGNCYFNTNQLGLAIWSYEKALLINPGLEDAKYNLNNAQKSVVDKIEALPRIGFVRLQRAISSTFHTNTWAWLSIIFLLFTCIAIAFVRISDNRSLNKIAIGKIFVFGFLFVFTIVFTQLSDHYKKPEAVLISDNAHIKNGPSETAEDLFILHEGIKVEILEINKNWFQIKLADGLIGWAEKKEFKEI